MIWRGYILKLEKKWEFVLAGFIIAVVAFILISYVVDFGNGKESAVPAANTDTSKPRPIQESAEPETRVETAKPEPQFDWASADVTEENVKKALKDNVGAAMAIPLTDERFRKFVTTSDTNGEYVEITLNPGMFADYKDFVKRAGGSLIAYSKVLFENPQIYELSLNVLIDNVGGGENDGVYISWRRDQAEGVDYEAVLDNMFGDYTIPYQLARKYSIQKDIYNGLEDFELPSSNNL